jgi:hypothetical protein
MAIDLEDKIMAGTIALAVTLCSVICYYGLMGTNGESRYTNFKLEQAKNKSLHIAYVKLENNNPAKIKYQQIK